jgi:hypothetical protein
MGEAGSMEPVDPWIDSGTLGIRGEVDHGAICTSQLQTKHKTDESEDSINKD